MADRPDVADALVCRMGQVSRMGLIGRFLKGRLLPCDWCPFALRLVPFCLMIGALLFCPCFQAVRRGDALPWQQP